MEKVKIFAVAVILMGMALGLVFLMLQTKDIERYVMANYPQIPIAPKPSLLFYFAQLLQRFLGLWA